MRTQRELSSLSPLHRASIALHASLRTEHKRNRSLLSSTAKHVITSTKPSKNLTTLIESHEVQAKTAGIVRALANFVIPEKNNKLEHLISKQFEDRRTRHLNLIKKFEVWQEKLNENITNCEKQVVKRWTNFVEASEKEVNRVIDTLNDEELLKASIEVVQAAFDNLQNHVNRRREEARSMFIAVKGLENDRKKSAEEFLAGLKREMVQVAYLLEFDISDLIQKYFLAVIEYSERELEKFDSMNQENIRLTQEFTEKFIQKMNEKMDLWKILHHTQAVELFISTVNGARYVNPEERASLFAEIRENQAMIYNLRTGLCREVCEPEMKAFSNSFVEGKIEFLNTENEKAQEKFDKLIQGLLNLQEVVFKELEEQFQITRDRILLIKAYEDSKLEQVINSDLRSLIDQRVQEWKDLSQKVIKFLDENDAKSQEVTNNLLTFIKALSQVSDDQRKRIHEENQKYSNDLAQRGDQLDENVENIEEKFKNKVESLKRTITLQELENSLQECIAVLEEIAQENRKYTEDISDMLAKHPAKITASCYVYLMKVLEKFGILPAERKDEIIAGIKLKKLEEMKLKTPDEAKRRLSTAKDLPEVKISVELEEVKIQGKKWVICGGLSEIIKELLITEEDREKELIKKQKEEEKRREEERRLLEEQQRREEAKKNKGKPSLKPEDPKKDELLAPSVQEFEAEEDIRPIDPAGNLILLDSLNISFDYFSMILTSLKEKFTLYISESENCSVSDAKSSDSQLLNSVREELDEKLRFLWPRKGKLEVNEFSNRSLEIRRHHNRWDRFVSELTPRKEANTKEFSLLTKELSDLLIKYKKDQDAIRLQLPKSTSIAEFQGLMRKNKDLEMDLFQAGSEKMSKLEELSEDIPEKLSKSCEDYLNNLILFEKGGDFDEKEVDYYRNKAKVIQNEILNEATKRKEVVEGLKKKFEADRTDPVKLFERDYGNALEGLAAKEGIGKKYGAPKRTAQEKIRAEMTKCEKAQEGIDGVLDSIQEVMAEFRQALATKNEGKFYTREPSLAITLRKLLISFRVSCQKYGTHISAFKDENMQSLKSLTWKEDTVGIGATIEEIGLEATRLEFLLEPLNELGVNKTPGNFTQKIAEIEKLAREESMKLYSGKALPDAVDRYYRLMKYYAEEFRSTRSKFLRDSCLKLQNSFTMSIDATLQSLELLTETCFENLCEKVNSKYLESYTPQETLRKAHQKYLRPNLANPSCEDELSNLNSSEQERYEKAHKVVLDLLSEFSKGSKEIAEEFRVKLQNNCEMLLFLCDVMFVYEDFAYVPGDEAPEVKRSHIKQLISKKKVGKTAESGDPRGKKKNWNGLSFSNLMIPGETALLDIPAIISYKSEAQKCVISTRNRVFSEFSSTFTSKTSEHLKNLNRTLKDEESWLEKWNESIKILKMKNE